MIQRILLVCTGNICRSPLAEALLRRTLEQRSVDGVSVTSAGTGAWDGAPASEGAYLVGTMARHHRARVDELGGEGRVFVLGEYGGREGDEAEVSDPFGGDLDVYRDTCAELEALVTAVVERLVKERQHGDRR